MSPPTLQSRLATHLRQSARPGLLSDSLLHLISRMLCFNPAGRVTAADALRHPYFADCAEAHADDGVVALPDDGEGRSVADIVRSLTGMQRELRLRLASEARKQMGVDMPGL